jgi:hypothetical protein
MVSQETALFRTTVLLLLKRENGRIVRRDSPSQGPSMFFITRGVGME